MKRYSYAVITAIALLTLNLTACGKQTTSSHATTSKQNSHVVKQPTAC
ncbi:MAG: hypothetical protein H9901_00795 [Candidatus Paralactobacillus gallistercoris]|uniref:Uncharacterized protein n=1 Tax=Candidatus Paralactobacillus gallistercoris TaxID=2838724 RepID=A0A948TI97_9LACO|nr:hypothetical protein [Candidatus Paralactobacillus gallistercoris]